MTSAQREQLIKQANRRAHLRMCVSPDQLPLPIPSLTTIQPGMKARRILRPVY